MGRKSSVEVGNKYNELTVLEKLSSKRNRVIWKCQCSCGNFKEVSSLGLVSNNTKSCGCLIHGPSWAYKGYKELSGAYWRTLQKRAKERKIDFDDSLTIEDVYKLLEQQNFKCALSGIDITIHRNYKKNQRHLQTASLDRIDSSKGYQKGNIQWVHQKVNIMKNTMSDVEFIGFCRAVVKNSGGV